MTSAGGPGRCAQAARVEGNQGEIQSLSTGSEARGCGVDYPHVRASGAERAQQRLGRRRAWEGRANFVTDATKSRLEEGGRVSSLPCEPGRSYHSPGGGGGAEGGSYHLRDKGAWTRRTYFTNPPAGP